MDRVIYLAMAGAKAMMQRQDVLSHNLANASTTGFRADMSAMQSRAVAGTGFASRVYATDSTTGWDRTSGAMQATGHDLDIAVQGEGWIAIQGKDGQEAYTRAGDLRVDPSGMLLNGAGHPVLADGGPITVPAHSAVAVAGDGTISIVPVGQGPETMATVGRIKLVNPPADSMVRGEDGLFRTNSGKPAPADASVHVSSGALESSNINVADAMVNMIELSRLFDLQVKAMRTAEENGQSSAQLLKLG